MLWQETVSWCSHIQCRAVGSAVDFVMTEDLWLLSIGETRLQMPIKGLLCFVFCFFFFIHYAISIALFPFIIHTLSMMPTDFLLVETVCHILRLCIRIHPVLPAWAVSSFVFWATSCTTICVALVHIAGRFPFQCLYYSEIITGSWEMFYLCPHWGNRVSFWVM